MSHKNISSSIRATQAEFKALDAIAASFGFRTRSKFILHAAKTYGRASDDPLIAELSGISFALHQAAHAKTGCLLTERDIADLKRRTRLALNAVIERNRA